MIPVIIINNCTDIDGKIFDGLEIFAEDVFQILAPELDAEEVIHLNIKIQKRCVVLNCHCPEVTIQTLNSLAIHNLIAL